MPYIIALVCLLVFYVLTVSLMKHMRHRKTVNFLFSTSILICYIYVMVTVYRSVGFDDWNFRNTLPVANISPFMFSLMAVIYLIPRKTRKHIYLLISLLSVGMLLAAVFGCIYNAYINYRFHLHFLSDYLAHVLLSLWGVYLVKSRQVELGARNLVASSGMIIGAAGAMLVLNMIFDTAFFGLSLNGKHNIYNNVLTDNSYLSAGLYFFGLICVLGIGYLFIRLLLRKAKRAS